MSENPLVAGSDTNPLKSDPELQSLLKRLDKVKKYKTFQRWKTKFLDRLEQFLYETGMKPATQTCDDFSSLLNKFVKSAKKVQDHIDKGDLGETKKTVKASLALNEMCNSLTAVVKEVEELIPSKSQEEKKRGYTKFHLGAVLIRQGFHQYITMKAIEDALSGIGAELKNVADRQQLDLFAEYRKQVQRFCDVMADLNLYEVMLKCLEFAEAPEEEESSDEEPVTFKITIDTHDGKILTLILDSKETIGNVKSSIAEGCGIPPDRQVLKFNEKNLGDDDATLESVGIQDGSKLTVEPFRVAVTVNTHDGQQLKVMVDPTDYVTDLKRQLADESGIEPKNQKLSMNGEEMDDLSKTCQDYGIKTGSVLDLEPKVMTIKVKTPDGKTISVKVKASDTTENVKTKIQEETGLKAPQQVLKHNGEEIPDGSTVKEIGIKDGSEIEVSIYKVPVTVNTMDGNQMKVMVDPTNYISDLKCQLEPESGVPAKNQALFMDGNELSDPNRTAGEYGIKPGSVIDLEPKVITVTVKTPNGNTIEVQVKPSDTNEDIKATIADKTGMKVPQQVLKHNGEQMPASSTVKEMGIMDGSEIEVDIFRIPVTVNTLDGRQIKVMVDPTDYISDLKCQLEPESGVPAKNQALYMDGNELSDPNKTAEEYGIKPGSTIDLEPKVITVNVKTPEDKTISVEVKSSDSGETIKEKIARQTDLKVPQQILKFGGKEMPNSSTVKQMGITDGSNIEVEIFRVPVTVNTPNGGQLKVMVDPTDKIATVKKQLEEESGVPATNQKLIMNGEELADPNKSAGDYGVKAGSVIDMDQKVIKLIVSTPDGKKITVEVSSSDTVEAVKEKIGKQSGLKVPQQVLKHNGKEMSDGKTMKDLGIKDGSDIAVEIFKVPVTVRTMDGKQFKAMVDPTHSIADLKKQLEGDSGLPASNQKLSMDGDEFADPNKTARQYGVKKGSVIDLEPKAIKVFVESPDGMKHTVEIKPSDTCEDVKKKVENASGMAAPRQVLKVGGKEFAAGKTVREMGISEGSELKVDIYTIPVKVKTPDGGTLSLRVEPTGSIDDIKKMIQKEKCLEPKKQILKFGDEELKNGSSTANDCGIKANSELVLEEQEDPIIFVDIKCGTLFAMDRDQVIEKKALTPHQNNKLDFSEAAKDSASKDRVAEAMKGSPTLGVASQVVVTGLEVEDYELEEAEKVQSVWGVNLKKRQKNKKGEEFIFVDPKTGACGELSRKKYLDMGFITPVQTGKGETLQERETDNLKYDKYIIQIRQTFGIKEFA